MFNVLFLCTGNSARSILAEAILNQLAAGRFRAFSAGSKPIGQIHPEAFQLLEKLNLPIANLRSKSWNEFSDSNALEMDLVITVCDHAAQESCPIWSGQPLSSHWSIADPAAVTDLHATQSAAFMSAYQSLKLLILALIERPFEDSSVAAQKTHLDQIANLVVDDSTHDK